MERCTSGAATLQLHPRSFPQILSSVAHQELGRPSSGTRTFPLFWRQLQIFAESAEFLICKLRVLELRVTERNGRWSVNAREATMTRFSSLSELPGKLPRILPSIRVPELGPSSSSWAISTENDAFSDTCAHEHNCGAGNAGIPVFRPSPTL